LRLFGEGDNTMAGPVPLVLCSRPEGRVAQYLRDEGLETDLLPLEVEWRPWPDRYAIGEQSAAERLTTQQFTRAIVTKTLFMTARDLQATVAAPIFVIEGEDFYQYGGMHPNAIRGALSALIVEYGASVLRTTEPADSAALIGLMARHVQFGVPEISLAAKRKAESPADEQRRLIEMLPAVGFTLARRLLQHFGTVERVLHAGPDELTQVRGLSKNGAARICELFCREYCAVDFEADIEDILAERPGLLLDSPVTLLDRQHFFTDQSGGRLIVDLVFADDQERVVHVVEIKRGALQRENERQLGAYLDAADRSTLLSGYMRRGYGLQGILAAPDSRIKQAHDERITIRIVDTEAVAEELMRRRLERLGESQRE
jgi:ERCC4-type nuclease